MKGITRIYLAQFNHAGKVDQTKFEQVAAETVRGAALKFASGHWPWPGGRPIVEVLVVPPNAPRHANGGLRLV